MAEIVMLLPMPAPSVRMPMIDWPPTVSPQRDTVTSASNCSAQ